MLSDDEWAQVACDIMDRIGLAPYGQDDDAVRWVAVRHAADHIHLVATLARQDGTRPRLWNDYFQVGRSAGPSRTGSACGAPQPRDRTVARRPTRAESEKARRRGFPEAARVALRRAVSTAAAAASSEQEFFARLDADRGAAFASGSAPAIPARVTGYAVALTDDITGAGGPVWFGGGKLAARPGTAQAPWPLCILPASGPPSGSPRRSGTRSGRMPLSGRRLLSGESQSAPRARYDPAAVDAAWAAADTLHAAAAASGQPGAPLGGRLFDGPPTPRTAGCPGRVGIGNAAPVTPGCRPCRVHTVTSRCRRR